MWKWYDSQIIDIQNETDSTKRLWVKIQGEEKVQFQAGQFVTMDLPISDKRLKRWRSYSIASAPVGEDDVLEFCVVKAEESTGGSKYLCDEATIGTPIRFKGPDGTFVLKQPLEKDLVLICTGTGVAPFRSMIWDIYNQIFCIEKNLKNWLKKCPISSIVSHFQGKKSGKVSKVTSMRSIRRSTERSGMMWIFISVVGLI
jgi:NAD(P)H-flavin reductase